MKAIFRKSSLFLMLVALVSVGMMAQPKGMRNFKQQAQGNGWYGQNNCMIENVIPDLSDEQKAELKVLRAKRLQSSLDFRNQMGEIRARQRTLMSAREIDEKAMNKLIDEKTNLMNQQQKEKVAQRAALNNVLTDEQQLTLQQKWHKRPVKRKAAGKATGYGKRSGRAHGQGAGMQGVHGHGYKRW